MDVGDNEKVVDSHDQPLDSCGTRADPLRSVDQRQVTPDGARHLVLVGVDALPVLCDTRLLAGRGHVPLVL